MLDIINALLPVFLLIILGAVFKKYHMPGAGFWHYAEQITFCVFLPCLFFRNVAIADFSGLDMPSILSVLVCSTALITVVLFICKNFINMSGAEFTSFFQGGIRFNNYVGIPSVFALYGNDGLVVSAIMIAVLVPLTSVAVIVVLNKYGDIDISGIRRNIISILANPLIIASLLGVAVNMAEFELPIFADRIIFSLGNVSLALGLLCVGAGLDLKAIKGKRPVIISSILCKLCVFPVTVLGLCLLFGLSGTAAQVMILYMGLPAASSSFIMARKMGGDATLMAGILFVETVVAMVTMPVLIMLSARLFG